jgi:L-ascorbate metabolism protein UlaG (beta-lactamase superfamily)
MESYISNPEAHSTAVKSPRMRGGPFVDLGGRGVEKVRELYNRTLASRAPQLQLSAALESLDAMLATQARGGSLHACYRDVPEPLRGYVELVYDIRHNASFRLIEPLLYRSKFYDKSAQSLLLSVTTGDDRPFVLSTPRFPSQHSLQLKWAFDDPRVDQLFRLRTSPKPWNGIRHTLEMSDEHAEAMRPFFTSSAPAPYSPYDGDGARWRYFGHACVLLEIRSLSILFDPVLSYTYESDISRYTYADLPDWIDHVVITHNHMDHILLETLLQIRHKVGQIIVPRAGQGAIQDPSLKMMFTNIGFANVREMGEFETLDLDEHASLVAIPFLGEHSDLAVTSKLAYVLRLGREQLMFAADSCNVEPRVYEHVHAITGDIGTLFIGMECVGAPLTWLYGPLMLRPVERAIDHARRLNGSDCAQALPLVSQFGCREVYVYAMGQEPWLNFVMSIKYTEQSKPIVESDRLIHECKSKGVVAERLFGEKEILLDRIWGATEPHAAAEDVSLRSET